MSMPPSTPSARRGSSAGFTLVELLVATLLGLGVTAGALVLFQHAVKASGVARQKLDMHDGIRVSLDLMVRDFIQTGQGLPAGRVVPIPSGAGATPVVRPVPPGPPATFGAATELPAVIVGNALGPAINGVTTDAISVIYADGQYDDAEGDLAVGGASLTVDAGFPITGVVDPVRAGDIIAITTTFGATAQYVTGVAGQTIQFAPGDAMNLNQPGAAAGSVTQVLDPAGVVTPCSLRRLRMVTYYVDNTNPAMPRLMRRLNLNAPRTVAFAFENLQFTYDLVDGAGNPTGVASPVTPNQIRKINVAVGARSRERSPLIVNTTAPTGPDQFFKASLTTQVSLRSLALVDRYF